MNDQNFDNFVLLINEALETESKDIALSDNFREYQEWNSLSRLSLIALLDEKFGILIQREDFEKLITIEDLYDFIQKATNS